MKTFHRFTSLITAKIFLIFLSDVHFEKPEIYKFQRSDTILPQSSPILQEDGTIYQ